MWGEEESRYVVGHYAEGGEHLFVSPGIGTSILPVRIGMPPEISQLVLRAKR
jgi:predicted MPP superfamily phosphohydrolase